MAFRRFGGRERSEGRGFGGPRRSFGERRESFREAPVKVGEEYDVEISETGSRGDGIARIKNFVVFIPNTKKGDKVRIKITELRGKSAVGEVVGGSEEKVTEEGLAPEVAEEEGEEESENF